MIGFSTSPGFANPVDDAQAVFRSVLDAFSRPGLPVSLAALPLPFPVTGFSKGMQAVALALCDSDTPLWLDEATGTPEVRHHLRFHCGSPFAEQPSAAAFAFIARPENMPRLDAFNPGKPDFPDRSATLIVNADLSESHGPAWELTGPGVRGNDRGGWQRFHAAGLPAWFWTDWEANHAAYPLGVDVLLVDSAVDDSGAPRVRLLGLPRTVRVRAFAPGVSGEQRACM